ncbi:hypothetical protein L3X39_06270 [Sabulilitoribacter multivorans]|uniref:Uncharacterized protein n=1 Tax=Flaviramulus multivorans TaxID=1304750 RepID=A0ABS9IHK1_9FLAO|nr:hypothetical protein [Flaviramulus multivorans]MCF7560239.1 hypothetical protein [Flaviramulus multivorans]
MKTQVKQKVLPVFILILQIALVANFTSCSVEGQETCDGNGWLTITNNNRSYQLHVYENASSVERSDRDGDYIINAQGKKTITLPEGPYTLYLRYKTNTGQWNVVDSSLEMDIYTCQEEFITYSN